jgi:hypothetical protein
MGYTFFYKVSTFKRNMLIYMPCLFRHVSTFLRYHQELYLKDLEILKFLYIFSTMLSTCYFLESTLTFGTGVLYLMQINHQTDATIFSINYPDVCLQFNMFRAFSRSSSGTQ